MNIKEKIEALKVDLRAAQKYADYCQTKLKDAESDISNHIYESLEKAENFLYNMFENQAQEDCEGSYNCGSETYTQDFIVDGKEYVATVTCEYDRHDKTYWYVDSCEYSYKEKGQ